MIRRPPRSTRKESSAASDVYKRQVQSLRELGKSDLHKLNIEVKSDLRNLFSPKKAIF